jgi:putative transposase
MPIGLKRFQNEADDHFITFSCFRREPYLSTPSSRDLVEQSLESTRKKYNFELLGYVIMPEHIHLLLGEPETKPLATAIQSLKLSISKHPNSALSGPPATTTSTSSPTTNE